MTERAFIGATHDAELWARVNATGVICFTWACGARGLLPMSDDLDEDSRVCDVLSQQACPECRELPEEQR